MNDNFENERNEFVVIRLKKNEFGRSGTMNERRIKA